MPRFSHCGFTVALARQGKGDPLVLLHGNTGASRMLASEIDFYSRSFQVTAIDLIGHGSSERLPELPVDFWRTNGCVALALCTHLSCPPVHALGTSGGAIVALSMALDAPGMVRSVVADSFVGTEISEVQARKIADQREAAKRGSAVAFWAAMHGVRWEEVVDADTRMLLHFARNGGQFFQRELAAVRCSVLFTASLGDELIGDARVTAHELSRQIPVFECELFESGSHPAMLSNAEAFRARAAKLFGS